jgi:hypothetical protein
VATTSTYLLDSTPTRTINRINLSPTRSSPSGSPTSTTFDTKEEFLHLESFKNNSYRGLVEKLSEYFVCIHDNRLLQAAMSSMINGRNKFEDMKSLMHFCQKPGGLLGHSSDSTLPLAVNDVFNTLSKQSIPIRMKELQAIHLLCEALMNFPHSLVLTLTELTSQQRWKLLNQFRNTPLNTSIHSYCDKGAWVDPALIPLLQFAGYKLVNSRLQLHRNLFAKNDNITLATMATLSIETLCK